MTTQELIDYYVNLLIVQFATKPNARASIAAFVSQIVQDQIYGNVGDAFNFTVTPIGRPVDGAAGVQLDAIAQYRGTQRVVYGLGPKNFFEFADALEPTTYNANGFMDALLDPSLVTWYFLQVQDTKIPLYSLTDDQLYRLIQFRARVQSMFLSLENIDNLIEDFFGNNVAMLDDENMTMIYVSLNSGNTDILFSVAARTQSLPRPAGVLAQALSADLLTDFFGLQDALTGYDPTFSGFSDALTTLTTGTFISAP